MNHPLFLRQFRCFLTALCLSGLVFAEGSNSVRFERMWPDLDPAFYLNAPTSIATNDLGDIYVVDSYNNVIKQFDSYGNPIRTIGGEGQLNRPSDIAVAADGSIYVVDNGNNRVQHYTAFGVLLGSFGSFGTGDTQFDFGLPSFYDNGTKFDKPGGIAIDLYGGFIYVADTGNNRIQVFDKAEKYLFSITQGLNLPTGLAVNQKNGRLYVADTGSKSVLEITSDTTTTVVEKLDYPTGVTVDEHYNPETDQYEGTGLLFIADNKQVYQYDIDKKDLGFLENPDFDGASGINVSPDGWLYVADTHHLKVQKIDIYDYSSRFYLGSSSAKPGYFYLPEGIAVAKDGKVYVADTGNDRIQRFTADGEVDPAFAKTELAKTALIAPRNIIMAENESLYVVDTGHDRIQQFSKDGRFLRQFGTEGHAPDQLDVPSDLAIAPDGSLYIADSGNNRIQHFTANGVFMNGWGQSGSGNSEFNNPNGITIAPNGTVYIADTDNNRLQAFDLQGKFLGSFGNYGTGQGQFYKPNDVEVLDDGSLLVVDTGNHRFQIISAGGQFLGLLGATGSAQSQFKFPTRVAIPADNSIYVVDSNNNRIQKFSYPKLSSTQQKSKYPWKAIILAGGGPSTETYNNPIWDSTVSLANRAFLTLRAQGFAKDEILYLTAGDTNSDLDGNAKSDDLQAANLANLGLALTTWAKDAGDVVVYLIDHGGPGTFKVNANEILTSEQLASWLKNLDDQIPGRITTIIEACKSGAFFPSLMGKERNLIASASAEQPAAISNQGLFAFSYYLWSEIRVGAKLQDAFKVARQGMSSQTVLVDEVLQQQSAQLDADGNGQFDSKDYVALGDYCLGTCTSTGSDAPEVNVPSPNVRLQGEKKLALQLQVKSLEPISSAWALLSRPDTQNRSSNEVITDLIKLDLKCQAKISGQYNYECESSYDKFDTKGNYSITLYAQDGNKRTSLPGMLTVVQSIGLDVSTVAQETRYIPSTGELILEDLELSGNHYWVKLHDKGGFQFEVIDYHGLPGALSGSFAHYDTKLNEATVPRINANGQHYSIILKPLANGLFGVANVKQL